VEERAGRPKLVEDAELEALFDEDPSQTQKELLIKSCSINHFHAYKALGMIQKQGSWVPYELKSRDLEKRFFTFEQLLV